MSKSKLEKISFVASKGEESEEALDRLTGLYGNVDPGKAEVIVALGGDGLMLQTAHKFMNSGIPVYGMNLGSVGFLMNEYNEDKLLDRLKAAQVTEIHPLAMTASGSEGETYIAQAINEVSLLRQTHQAAKLKISIDGQVRMDELICDGLILATPAGSTAYNLSAHGSILPINSPLLALTPISPFRPRRWRGALLPNLAKIRINVLESAKRPVSVVADHTEFRDICSVEITEDQAATCLMLFDPGHNLDERILREQFLY